MRSALVIARRELAGYVSTPMGWIVAATTLLLDGLLFYALALGPAAGPRLSAEVLSRFFWTTSGLVPIAAVTLSVRLLTEERQLDTLVLLSTAPVRDREIVLGKFLAALAFLALLTLLTIYMPLLVLVNGKISVGQVGVGYLGLLLLGGAVLAIGLFASSLTRHTLLAVALGAAITAAMFLLYPLGTVLDPPLGGVLRALSLHGDRFFGFQTGVVHLRDVVYYLSVIYFFLLVSTKVLEAKRWE
jgi:ABC-2 type transport system permease protein